MEMFYILNLLLRMYIATVIDITEIWDTMKHKSATMTNFQYMNTHTKPMLRENILKNTGVSFLL